MLISYQWLQSYFKDKIPAPEKLAELFTFHFSEVESLDKLRTGEDWIFDLKILPDRACYALSHRGVAREVAAILDIPLKKEEVPAVNVGKTRTVAFTIENPDACRRHIGRVIEGITVKESPQWLKERLESVGARAINNVVDATNYVTLAMGQPLHAFDADKLATSDKRQATRVAIRMAKKGEQVTLLDGRVVTLDEADIVIADDEAALDIAGIKGGKKAELDAKTTSILLSAANFDPVRIRRTSQKTGVQTDASKRFENNLTPARAEEGMEMVAALIAELAGGTVGEKIDVYPRKAEERRISFDVAHITRILGVEVNAKEVVELLERLDIRVEGEDGQRLSASSQRLSAVVPLDRLDLAIPEDIAEEVGRIIGYDKVPLVLPPKSDVPLSIPKQFYWEWKIRECLVNEGFSEVMTSSFSSKGEVAIEKPLAEDKKYARPELRGSFAAALEMNYRNAPLFGSDEVKVFEIGKVFPLLPEEGCSDPSRSGVVGDLPEEGWPKGRGGGSGGGFSGEHAALAIGYAGPKGKGKNTVDALKKLSSTLGVELKGETKEGVFECNLDAVIEKLPEPTGWNLTLNATRLTLFTPFSAYPFIVRDVALFVPSGTDPEKVLTCIRKEAGELAVCSWKFDEFEKSGKLSFAFRIVFQSFEKTLTDAEANAVMEKIYAALKKEFKAEIR
jgi:phenylalanyl-tRNA synthetase beta chain